MKDHNSILLLRSSDLGSGESRDWLPRPHGWRIVKTPGGAFALLTVQFIFSRRILAVLIMDLP